MKDFEKKLREAAKKSQQLVRMKTFRLDDEAADELESLAKKYNVTEGEIVRAALMYAFGE